MQAPDKLLSPVPFRRGVWLSSGAFAFLLFASLNAAAASSFVQSSGTNLVVKGKVLTPVGVNLGNWFVLEPYMIGGGWQLQFTRLSPATVAYVVQASDDLSGWPPIASLNAGSAQWSGRGTVNETPQGSALITVSVTDPGTSSSACRFLRLQVTDPSP